MSRFRHRLPFGAELQPEGSTRFRVWAPSVEHVTLRLPSGDVPMRAEDGGWQAVEASAPAGTPYSYVLPDGVVVPDPAARAQQVDVHGPSVVVDPGAYAWRCGDWAGRPWHEAVVYECHSGLMGGFRGLQARLPELAALGVTMVELMPVAGVPGGRNWGYDGVLPFAPDAAYGTPDELKAMIDAAHGLGVSVILDVVYNHFGPDGAYVHLYAKRFFRNDIKTPWGDAIDFRWPEVRRFFIENALFWLEEYRFDGFRFDAVHAIADETFLVDLAHAIRGAAAGRHVHLVLENEQNRASLLGGAPLYDAQWADDWHQCVHVLLTGEREGYYRYYQDATTLLATCLADGFAYQGQADSARPRRGEPSGGLPTSAFVICLQNHDQIGNRAFGERLTTLADPAALRAATVLLLLSPFVPMLFMGEEWASTTPFLFFTNFKETLAQAVREGRRADFRAFAAFRDPALRSRIPDPNAASTYEASRPERTDPAHAEWVADLLRLRHAHVVPGVPGCRSAGVNILGVGALQATWTLGTNQTLTILFNIGKTSVTATSPLHPVLFATPGSEGGTFSPGSIAVHLG